MRTSILLVAAVLFAAGAAPADLMQWHVRCGLTDNAAPYGSDWSTRFGVAEGATWEFDVNDSAHPPVCDPRHDLAFIYSEDYYTVYRDRVLHDVGPFHWDEPVGWPPPDGRHGAGVPLYPDTGLLNDARMPILTAGEPEIWLVTAYAPLSPNDPPYGSATCSFIWEWNREPGYEVPELMVVQIWGNPELESVGIYGDMVLNEFGPGYHIIRGIAQWGTIKVGTKYYPIEHDWIIQATLVPEPAVAPLAGLVFGIGGSGIRRLRRESSKSPRRRAGRLRAE
jgi:hypothetical protein